VRVLLIGGNGFIGSHIADEFLRHELDVTVFDRYPEKYREPLPKVRFVRGEMGNRGALEPVIAGGIDVVVILASSTLPHNNDPVFDVQSNLVETLAVLESCVKYKVRKVVFASSGGTVYGIPQFLPIPEEHPTEPVCSYGIVKLAIENYLRLYSRFFGLQYVALRLSNPFGIRQDPLSAQGIVSVFTARIMQHQPLTVWGTGDIVRDYIHIRDVASIFYEAVCSETCGIFNIGSGVGVSIKELITLISSHLNTEPTINWERPRDFDVPAIILDCEKARRSFSWEPKGSLTEGISEIAHWLRTDKVSADLKNSVAGSTK